MRNDLFDFCNDDAPVSDCGHNVSHVVRFGKQRILKRRTDVRVISDECARRLAQLPTHDSNGIPIIYIDLHDKVLRDWSEGKLK